VTTDHWWTSCLRKVVLVRVRRLRPKAHLHTRLESIVRPGTIRELGGEPIVRDRPFTSFGEFAYQRAAVRAQLRLADRPLPRLAEAGLMVTLNTDGETPLAAEYERAREIFGYRDAELARLARASIEGAFAPES
jgi:Adenosine deaminase